MKLEEILARRPKVAARRFTTGNILISLDFSGDGKVRCVDYMGATERSEEIERNVAMDMLDVWLYALVNVKTISVEFLAQED